MAVASATRPIPHGTRTHTVDSSLFRFFMYSLKGVDVELQSVAQTYGGHADRLYHIVEENELLQKKIQKNLQSQLIQNILTMALKTDANMNFSFDAEELKRLKYSMSQIPGVTLDAQNFDQMFRNTKELSLSDIMRMLRNFLKEETPEEKKIVHLTPRKIVQRGFFG